MGNRAVIAFRTTGPSLASIPGEWVLIMTNSELRKALAEFAREIAQLKKQREISK